MLDEINGRLDHVNQLRVRFVLETAEQAADSPRTLAAYSRQSDPDDTDLFAERLWVRVTCDAVTR
jgi:hypothetical protein